MCNRAGHVEYNTDMSPPDLHEEFMRMFIAAEPKLRAYAGACGLTREQVDDVAQEGALVLWRRFESYDRTKPFLPWALGVAHHLIQKAREGTRRIHILPPEIAEKVAGTCAAMEGEIDVRRSALRKCVAKLPAHLRSLLNLRYGERLPLAEVAQKLQRGLSATNMALHRVRQVLQDCVQREGVV
jgi:RNA polymerase sigma-70 factor, ECF subfamily